MSYLITVLQKLIEILAAISSATLTREDGLKKHIFLPFLLSPVSHSFYLQLNLPLVNEMTLSDKA